MTRRFPRTLPALFDRALTKYADREAVRDEVQSLTYDALNARSMALANALADLGVATADRVGVLLENATTTPVVDIAILRAGGTRLPLNPQHSTEELRYMLADAGAETLVCDETRIKSVAAVVADVDALQRVVVVGTGDGGVPISIDRADVYRYETLVSRYDSGADDGRDADSKWAEAEPDDIAGHYYTGGTTGQPKGVCYSHRGLVQNMQAHLLEFGFDGNDVGLLTTSLSHSAGTFCWAALLGGGTVLLRDTFRPTDVAATIERAGVTWMFLVPTMLYRILDADSLESVDTSSLQRVIYGAAPIRVGRLKTAIDRVGNVFHQFYGQTEVPNLITSLPPREHLRASAEGSDRLRSAGTPCMQVTVEIRDTKTDEVLPPGEIGEVVVAAPYVFNGYYERPETTAETLRDGWVYTGDIGRIDDDGYLTLLDRDKDVIVTGGMNVYSRAVERVLCEHPDVDTAVVVGVPDDDWGEAVHAVVVPAGSTVDTESIGAHADERLAGYKKPKSYEIVKSIPTTDLGKVDRKILKEPHWDGEDRSVH